MPVIWILCEVANFLRIDADTSFGNTVYELNKMCLWASRLYLWFKGNPVGALLSVLHPEAFHRLAQCMSLDVSHGLGTVLAWAYCRWNSDYLVTCPQQTTFTEVRQTINEMSRKNTLYIRNASKKKKIR